MGLAMGSDLDSVFELPEGGIRAIVERAPVAMAVVDGRGRLLLANKAARELGLRAGLASIASSLSHGTEVDSPGCEIALTDRRGAQRRLEVKAADLADEVRVLVFHDVTESAGQREELAQLRRVESVGLVASRAVHDFSNLLTPILCSTALLMNELESTSHAADLVREIRSAAERATVLSRQILGLARRPSEWRARFDANVAIREMRGLIRLALPEDVDLTIACAETPVEVLVDRVELESALLNLVSNARDAMPLGGRLTVGTASACADEHAETGGGPGYVSISVTDTGVGMASSVRERLFEQFFTTKSDAGTGLGLPSVHAFVRRHGGCVSVRSHPGQGTTVILYFPCLDPIRRSPQSGVRLGSPPGNNHSAAPAET
jgi:signal transduction histidine kinase